MKKRLLVLGLAAAMTMSSAVPAFAAPNDSSVKKIKQKQSSLKTEVSSMNDDLVSLLADMDVVEKEISQNEKDMAKVQKQLKAAQAQKAKQYDAMKKRIQYQYENGQSGYLVSMMESTSFGEVLNKASYFNAVYQNDQKMMAQYQAQEKKVDHLVKEAKEKQSTLKETKEDYKNQKAQLKKDIEKKKSKIKDFDQKLEKEKKLAAEYAAALEEQNLKAQSEDTGKSQPAPASKTGNKVIDYAAQFVGNPYVWGGTSLTNGCDCSGYVMSVYAHFGKSLPHSSSALRSVGSAVAESDMQPGDIVCYAGHVGLYAGNGQLLNASNSAPYPQGGIKYTNVHYRTILAVRRVM